METDNNHRRQVIKSEILRVLSDRGLTDRSHLESMFEGEKDNLRYCLRRLREKKVIVSVPDLGRDMRRVMYRLNE